MTGAGFAPGPAAIPIFAALHDEYFDALSVFATVRARLADELGVDPGPALRAAHRQVLGAADQYGPADGPRTQTMAASAGLVGRVEELAALRQAVGPALTGGTGLAWSRANRGAARPGCWRRSPPRLSPCGGGGQCAASEAQCQRARAGRADHAAPGDPRVDRIAVAGLVGYLVVTRVAAGHRSIS